jgi:hypothetical protein
MRQLRICGHPAAATIAATFGFTTGAIGIAAIHYR